MSTPNTPQPAPANTLKGLSLENRIALLEHKVTALHPHTLLYYTASILVAVAAIGVPAYLASKNLAWLQETHERDEATNRRMRNDETKRAHFSKMLDIATYFIKRFYEIERTKEEDKRTGFYYEQMWGLHSEEFYYYKNGLLDKDTYQAWLQFRWRVFHKSPSEEKLQWERLKKDYLISKNFVTFIDSILANPESSISSILESEKVE